MLYACSWLSGHNCICSINTKNIIQISSIDLNGLMAEWDERDLRCIQKVKT